MSPSMRITSTNFYLFIKTVVSFQWQNVENLIDFQNIFTDSGDSSEHRPQDRQQVHSQA